MSTSRLLITLLRPGAASQKVRVLRRCLLMFAALACLGLLQLARGEEAALPEPAEEPDLGSFSVEIPEIYPLLRQRLPSWVPHTGRRRPARHRRRLLVVPQAPAPISTPEQESPGGGFKPMLASTAGPVGLPRGMAPPVVVPILPLPFPPEFATPPSMSVPARKPDSAVRQSAPPSSETPRSPAEPDGVNPPGAVSPRPVPAVAAGPSLKRNVTAKLIASEVVSGPVLLAPERMPPAKALADASPVLEVGSQIDLEQLGQAAFSQLILVQASGILGGSGVIPGGLLNRGTVSPGHSPGLLEIAGDYTQSEDAELDIELAGTNPKDFDRIIVEGVATLSGLINVLLIDGFLPQEGDIFTVLEAEQIIDEGVTFALPDLGASSALFAGILDLGGTQVLQISMPSSTQLAAVPEVSTALLLAVGLGGLGALRRLRPAH